MIKEYFQLISALVMLLANIALALAYFINLRKLSKELKAVKIIVNDTDALREAIRKPLEGTWKVVGHFKKFQNDDTAHYSNGYVIFTWIPAKAQYEVKYMYTITKENESIDLLTVFCSGNALGDRFGNIKKRQPLTLNLSIKSNSAQHETKLFQMTSTKYTQMEDGKINSVIFDFSNKNTQGSITFSR